MDDRPVKPSLREKWRTLWQIAKMERAEPHQIGLAVFLGAFVGSSPLLGFHGWAAIAGASVLKLNRLYAWIGSRISNVFILPFIVYAEIETARFLRTGHGVALDRAHALEQAPHLLLDWCIGTLIIGPLIGAVAGGIAYWIAKRRFAKRGTPPEPHPPISESRV